MEGNFEGGGKKDIEALEAAVNKPDSTRMYALSAKAEALVQTHFTEPGFQVEKCYLWVWLHPWCHPSLKLKYLSSAAHQFWL